MKNVVRKIDRSVAFVENTLIILILTVMVLMAFLQVLLRNLFETGILWGDVFLRHLVLWVGFLGASLATREEKHINIDILTRVITKKYVPFVKMIVDLITIVICVFLAKAGYTFVQYEKEARTILFQNVLAWYFEVIIPAGFTLIGFRFFLKLLEQVQNIFSKSVTE